jgi:hypothetical protein
MAMRRLSLFAFVAVGLAVAAALVILVAPRASSSPDGLEKVAAEKGIDADARAHAFEDGPFADYGTSGVDNEATIVAGLVGVAVTSVVCGGLVLLVRRRGQSRPTPAGQSG